MVDTPSTNRGLREQARGTNTNTWGDTKLNEVVDCIDQLVGKIKTIAITGDYTPTTTNYVATADNKNAGFKFTGALTANATITLGSVYAAYLIINATTGGYSLAVKTAAGATVTVPASAIAWVYTDGTDALIATPNYFGSKRLQGIADGTAATDAVSKLQMETAIAAASGLTAPFLLVSSGDTTANYLANKTTVNYGGLTTTQVAGLTSFQLSIQNAGGNEKLLATIGQGYVGGFLPGGDKAAQFTPVAGTEYNCDFTASSWTVNLSGMTTPQVGHRIKLNCFGNFQPFLLGTVNGLTNLSLDAGTSAELAYSSASWGWN